MPAVLEGAVPPPHLHHLTSDKSWPSQGPHPKYPSTPSPSVLSMSPEPMHSYMPHLHDDSIPNQDLNVVPTSGWYGPSAPAPNQAQTNFPQFNYEQSYVTPHTSSITYSSPQYTKSTISQIRDPPTTTFSPAPEHSKLPETTQSQTSRQSDATYVEAPRTPTPVSSAVHLQVDTNPPTRPRSSPSAFAPNQNPPPPVDYPWAMNNLGLAAPLPDHYYAGGAYPAERRMYAPIAPNPLGPQGPPGPPGPQMQRTSAPKRSRDDDDLSDQSKRRKRSDSNNATFAFELNDEDRLLIRLKDEDGMPWKDIAARFQSELGKHYQIPALQMRLKRLRERMRKWTEADIRALRLAHEYWVQNKFDIISQKMLEFGAAEKWTTRQCARKWAEIDPGPTPYSTYDHYPTHSYATYAMSPVEPQPPSFTPYLHMPPQ